VKVPNPLRLKTLSSLLLLLKMIGVMGEYGQYAGLLMAFVEQFEEKFTPCGGGYKNNE
jgi:hypothetical protein